MTTILAVTLPQHPVTEPRIALKKPIFADAVLTLPLSHLTTISVLPPIQTTSRFLTNLVTRVLIQVNVPACCPQATSAHRNPTTTPFTTDQMGHLNHCTSELIYLRMEHSHSQITQDNCQALLPSPKKGVL